MMEMKGGESDKRRDEEGKEGKKRKRKGLRMEEKEKKKEKRKRAKKGRGKGKKEQGAKSSWIGLGVIPG